MKKLLAYLGVDRAIAYTLATRGWGLLSSFVTMLMVVHHLTPEEQGYYYTFASLLAAQIFFELGMSVVVMQFASHEMAHLSWTEKGTLDGDASAKSRLRSLVLFVAKWYGVIAIFIVVAILPIGWAFFSANHSQSAVNWQLAWAWLVVAAAANIFFMPFLAMLEGCGRVTEVAELRMKQNLIGSLLSWSVLAVGGGLLALPALNSGLAVAAFIWLWRTKKNFFMNLLSQRVSAGIVKWKEDIWPFQWRIAVSWLSGYFIFQLFTPILFAYRGAVEAGQMGMSLAIANALMSIAVAWMNTKAPGFGSYIAKRNYLELDRVFNLAMSRSLAVMVFVGCGLCAVNYVIHAEPVQFSSRVLDPLPFLLLVLATVFAYVTYAEAAYLRAHKVEPFMWLSLIIAALIGGLTVLLGKEYGATGLMAAYAVVYGIVGVGWGSKIFLSKRREWQNNCSRGEY